MKNFARESNCPTCNTSYKISHEIDYSRMIHLYYKRCRNKYCEKYNTAVGPSELPYKFTWKE
jgi:hypothetical protein